MPLRYYQQDAIDESREVLGSRPGASPLIVLPTGAGKSHIIASIAEGAVDRGGKVLILAHRKELLVQNAEKISGEVYKTFCCAALGEKNMRGDVVLGTRGSVVRLVDDVFSVIIIDEAHRVNSKDEGEYRTILAKCPSAVVVGLTATPFRLTGSKNCSLLRDPKDNEDPRIFTDIVGNPSIKRLIREGYLCKMVSKVSTQSETNDSIGTTSFGEYNMKEASDVYCEKVKAMCEDMLSKIGGRKKIIIFCCGVSHARKTTAFLTDANQFAEYVVGDTDSGARAQTIQDFKDGEFRFLVGCDIFTEGFDVPDIDCVVLMRPTQSAALYVQMVGRGLRTHPEKTDCLALDYGGNIERHGPIDFLDIQRKRIVTSNFKICSMCESVMAGSTRECADCGFEFPKIERPERPEVSDKVEKVASEKSLFKDSQVITEHEVKEIVLRKHRKKDFDASKRDLNYTVCVEYYASETDAGYVAPLAKQYLCFNHSGFPRGEATKWWSQVTKGAAPPVSVDDALSRWQDIFGVAKIKIIDRGKKFLPKIQILEIGKSKVRLHSSAKPQKVTPDFGFDSVSDDQRAKVKETKAFQLLKQSFPGSTIEDKPLQAE